MYCFCDFGIDDNCPEADCVLHELHLDSVGCGEDVEKLFTLLIVYNFVQKFRFEWAYSHSRPERQFKIIFLSRLDDDSLAWSNVNIDEHFLQLFQLVIYIECYFDFLFRVVDNTNYTVVFLPNFCDSKIDVLIFGFFDLEF